MRAISVELAQNRAGNRGQTPSPLLPQGQTMCPGAKESVDTKAAGSLLPPPPYLVGGFSVDLKANIWVT